MTGLLGEVDMPAPIGDRWFEDYVPGSVSECGQATLIELVDPFEVLRGLVIPAVAVAVSRIVRVVSRCCPSTTRNSCAPVGPLAGDGARTSEPMKWLPKS